MTEKVLLDFAGKLPECNMEFRTIEAKMSKPAKERKSSRPMLRTAIAIALIACLITTVYAYGQMKYGLWSVIHSNAYGDVVLLNWKYDYYFPETLNGVTFMQMSTYYGAPQGATHLEALFAPTYEMHNVDYGVEMWEEREDAVTYGWVENQINISFGTTRKEQWRYHFSVAEDGSCDYEGVNPGSQRTEEYKGYTLHLYTVGDSHNVRWEDTARELVISISCYGAESQEAVVEIAKELIDVNSQ